MQQYLNRIPECKKLSDVTQLVRDVNEDRDLTFEEQRYLISYAKDKARQLKPQ